MPTVAPGRGYPVPPESGVGYDAFPPGGGSPFLPGWRRVPPRGGLAYDFSRHPVPFPAKASGCRAPTARRSGTGEWMGPAILDASLLRCVMCVDAPIYSGGGSERCEHHYSSHSERISCMTSGNSCFRR